MGRYITQGDLEDYLSADVVAETLDDDNNGLPDPGAVDRIIADAENLVDRYLRGIYALPLTGPIDPSVVSLALNAAAAILASRHPEYVRIDGEKRKADVIAELTAIRNDEAQLAHALIAGAGVPDVISDTARDPSLYYPSALGSAWPWRP